MQIRLIGETKINYQNEDTQKSWESSQAISKKCYSVKEGSSAKIENPKDVDFDIKSINVEDGYENFCTLKISTTIFLNFFTYREVDIGDVGFLGMLRVKLRVSGLYPNC